MRGVEPAFEEDADQAPASVQPASARRFELIRVELIDVVTPRNRGTKQLQENVRSIAENGLYKPVLLNAREFEKTGRYQLVCGEGRLHAHRELKHDVIKAEIIDVDLATAFLMSLGENLTKCKPRAVEYAYALLDMHEKGASLADLERVTGHPTHYIKSYINLVRRGEERLIKGVDRGLFPLDFAMKVAESPDAAVQHVLMDAFDKKYITAKHVDIVRTILTDRMQQGKELKERSSKYTSREAPTAEDLKRDIQRITREKEKFVFAVESKETRLMRLLECLRVVRADTLVLDLLRRHQLDSLPTLEGKYGG